VATISIPFFEIFTLPANRAGTVQALLETNEETWLQTPDEAGSSPFDETVKNAGPEVLLRIQIWWKEAAQQFQEAMDAFFASSNTASGSGNEIDGKKVKVKIM
jgi:hypothetical protein